MSIHATAIIDPRAEVDSSVQIEPYVVVKGPVRIGANTRIGSHAVLTRSEERRVGKECRSRWSPYH